MTSSSRSALGGCARLWRRWWQAVWERRCGCLVPGLGGDWEARTDLDQITVAPLASEAESLADRFIQALLDNDVIALESSDWQARRSGGDPHWRAIGRDAILIAAGSKP